MGWRGPVVLAALLALGTAGGYVASRAQQPGGDARGVPSPVAASGPRFPVDPPIPTATDPADPALRPNVPLTTDTLGTGKFALAVPVPVGWTMNQTASNEAKWKEPGTSNNTYVMRVEQTAEDGRTIPEALDQRVRALRDEQDDVRLVPGGRTEDSVEYTYTSNEGTRRHSFIRWVDVSGSGLAEVEVVVHGRTRDVPGTRDLVRRVAEGLRPA